MKVRQLSVLLLCLLLLSACGYHNPNVIPASRDLPPTRIHVPMWTNATSQMGLGVKAHNAVSNQLTQSDRVMLIADQAQAEYVLSGHINSLSFPGFAYDPTSTVRSLTAVMTVTVTISARASGRIIWQDMNLRLEQNYNLGATVSQSDANKRRALDQLVDNLAEQVYLRALRSLNRNRQL